MTILILMCLTLQWLTIAVLAWRIGGELLDRETKHAYQSGAEKMREQAAKECESWDCGNEDHRRPHNTCHVDDAIAIRALPITGSRGTPESESK